MSALNLKADNEPLLITHSLSHTHRSVFVCSRLHLLAPSFNLHSSGGKKRKSHKHDSKTRSEFMEFYSSSTFYSMTFIVEVNWIPGNWELKSDWFAQWCTHTHTQNHSVDFLVSSPHREAHRTAVNSARCAANVHVSTLLTARLGYENVIRPDLQRLLMGKSREDETPPFGH